MSNNNKRKVKHQIYMYIVYAAFAFTIIHVHEWKQYNIVYCHGREVLLYEI